jgi:opacity protein-like surface antigen
MQMSSRRPLALSSLTIIASLLLTAAIPGRAEGVQWVSHGDDGQPWIRPHRLALGLGFALGYAPLSGVARMGDKVVEMGEQTYGVDFDFQDSSLTLGGLLSLRYYGPFHLMAEVGVGLLHNRKSVSSARELAMSTYVVEVPLLLGGYLSLGKRTWIYGAAGPTFFVHNALVFEAGTDFDTPVSVGFQAIAGIDLMLRQNIALGLEGRFRAANLGELEVTGTNLVLTDNGETYDLDVTGFSVLVTARVFIF